MQWIGALIVMACTFVELLSKKKKKVEEVVTKDKKSN